MLLVAALAPAPASRAASGNLTSPEELARLRARADAGDEPFESEREALFAQARAPWAWGGIGGRMLTSERDGAKRCHPAYDRGRTDYLKEGAPDAYAKVLGWHLGGDDAWLDEARRRVLDLTATRRYRGLDRNDWSGDNQCLFELAISIPIWIETALLLEGTPVWSDADTLAFQQWLASQVYPKVAWASRQRRNNWGAAGSLSATLVALYVDGAVPELVEKRPEPRSLTPAAAAASHVRRQLDRIGRRWKGDTPCRKRGIRGHGGIPDELRRGSTGCDGKYLRDDDKSWIYHTLHVQLLIFHAEALRRRGDRSLFDAPLRDGTPALLQAILFVIDNPKRPERSWPWAESSIGSLVVAERYYDDPRVRRASRAGDTVRGGRILPYAFVTHLLPLPAADRYAP